MTDRKLLELAAKAAGVVGNYFSGSKTYSQGIWRDGENDDAICWNPLTDDGDALRLAVKLRMNIRHYSVTSEGPDRVGIDNGYGISPILYDGDPNSATRRAIVLAAAEIGKGMQ